MAFDAEQLRQHYASLTDEALLEIDPSELVDAARQCLDEELRRRRLRSPVAAQDSAPMPKPWVPEADPAWAADAMTAMSSAAGRDGDIPALDARAVLIRAGIPCHVAQRDPETPGGPAIYDLLVPPGQHLLALSILDRDFFNPQLVEDWQAHFAVLSDDELLEMDADLLVAGMRDRIERLVRAYEDELLKRGLAELETGSGG